MPLNLTLLWYYLAFGVQWKCSLSSWTNFSHSSVKYTQWYFALPFSTPDVCCFWWWPTGPQSHAYFSLCVWGWGISIDLALSVLILLSSISNLLSTCSSNCVPRLSACSINPFPSLHLVFFSLNYSFTFYIKSFIFKMLTRFE